MGNVVEFRRGKKPRGKKAPEEATPDFDEIVTSAGGGDEVIIRVLIHDDSPPPPAPSPERKAAKVGGFWSGVIIALTAAFLFGG